MRARTKLKQNSSKTVAIQYQTPHKRRQKNKQNTKTTPKNPQKQPPTTEGGGALRAREEADTWLTQDTLAKCCSETLDYYPFDSRRQGRFYAGIDLTERVDHSVIAVLERTENLQLVHMHRFKKGTSIASVIGYAKLLSERWNRIHATYVHQTANTVLKAYDGHVINEKLEELTRRVEELMEEAEKPGAGPGDAEHSGSEQGVPVLVPGYEW